MMMEMAPSVMSKTQAFKMLSATRDTMSKFKVNKAATPSSYCLGCHKPRDIRISSEQSLAEVVWAVSQVDSILAGGLLGCSRFPDRNGEPHVR